MRTQDRLDHVLQVYALTDELGSAHHLSSECQSPCIGNPDFWQEASCIELRKRCCIDGIGLDLVMRDHSQLLGIGDDDPVNERRKKLRDRCCILRHFDDYMIIVGQFLASEGFEFIAKHWDTSQLQQLSLAQRYDLRRHAMDTAQKYLN